MSDIQEIWHDTEDGHVVERRFDCAPIIESVKREKSIKTPKCVPGLGYKAATIPLWVIEDYCNKNGVSSHEFWVDRTHIMRIMRSPEYSAFRVWEGRV